GRIDPADHARATEFGRALRDRFGSPHEGTVRAAAGGADVDLGGPVRLDHVELSERLEEGQRVTSHRILDGQGRLLAEGGTIGVRRIHRLEHPVTASSLRIETVGDGAVVERVAVHDAGDAPVPDLTDAYRAPTEVPESSSMHPTTRWPGAPDRRPATFSDRRVTRLSRTGGRRPSAGSPGSWPGRSRRSRPGTPASPRRRRRPHARCRWRRRTV